MNIVGKLVEAVTQSVPLKEQMSQGTPVGAWPSLAQVDNDEYLYRQLTSGLNPRDLTTFDQARMIEICFFLARTNPMAKRIVNTIADFVWGNGPIISAANPIVDDILQEFWNDPINQWAVKGHTKVRDLSIYGEQAWPLATNSAGRVRVRYLSPSRIKAVIVDPDDPELVKGVIPLNNPVQSGGVGDAAINGEGPDPMGEQQLLVQLHREENLFNGEFGYWMGDILYMAINKTGDGKRGVSDLYDTADWIDVLDQALFSRTEKMAHMNQFFWDVTLQGADQKKIDDWLREQMKIPQRPGAIRAHNEAVLWTPQAPKLEAGDAAEDIGQIKSHIMGGVGFPSTWFPGGDNTRAAAVEMAEPTMRSLATRQAFVRENLVLLLKYVIQQRLRANPELAAQVNGQTSFVVEMDSVTTRDLYRAGTAFWRVIQGIQIAMQMGIIEASEARMQYLAALDMMGLAYAPEKDLEQGANDSILSPAYGGYLPMGATTDQVPTTDGRFTGWMPWQEVKSKPWDKGALVRLSERRNVRRRMAMMGGRAA
jgi:hypothetical protein